MWRGTVSGHRHGFERECSFIAYGGSSRIDARSIEHELLPGFLSEIQLWKHDQVPTKVSHGHPARSICQEPDVMYLYEALREYINEEPG